MLRAGLIGLIGGVLVGWWAGSNHVEGQWAKAESAALRAQETLTREAIDDMKAANAATDAASITVARNASGSRIAWSAGMVSSRGESSPDVDSASCAARASAGAVLRPSGSRITAAGVMPTDFN